MSDQVHWNYEDLISQAVSYHMWILLVSNIRQIAMNWPDMKSMEFVSSSVNALFLSVLAIAVNKLERVNLADTFITDEQLKLILQQVHP